MLDSLPLLSMVTFFPLIGVVLILAFAPRHAPHGPALARGIALGISAINLFLAACVVCAFDPTQAGFQLIEKVDWIPALGVSYHKGIDGISLWFVPLSAFLSCVAVLSGFGKKERVQAFMIALLILQTIMIGVFTSLDFFLFYLFFEGVLIPMFLLIGVWGGERRIYAATKFFLYTFLGSILMLVGIFAMVLEMGTSDMTAMIDAPFSKTMALWLWIVFFASFAVKTPMWPFHTWLPHAHVEAPTAGSVLLAGVLLKMGGYGFIRISLDMLPEASAIFAPFMVGLSLVAIIYAALVALAQTDMKKMIAYSSVAHMGHATLGIFSGRAAGLEGGLMVMLSHGIVAAALFVSVGLLHSRRGTRDIAQYGGVAHVMPRFSVLMMIFTLAAIGMPGTSGFVGEYLTLQGAWARGPLIAASAGVGIVLTAAYMLWLYRRVFFGAAVREEVSAMKDINGREALMLVPMAALILWMGLYPTHLRDAFAPATERVMERVIAAKEAGR